VARSEGDAVGTGAGTTAAVAPLPAPPPPPPHAVKAANASANNAPRSICVTTRAV
jgi:hypothetical protein